MSDSRNPAWKAAVLFFGIFAVWGLLGGIVLPGSHFNGPKAKVSAARTQLDTFRSVVESYAADNGRAPTTAQGLIALIDKPTVGPLPQHWRGAYLPDVTALPNDPWGNPYGYASPEPGTGAFVIWSYGADGKPGGRGYDADIVVRKVPMPQKHNETGG